MRCPTPGSPAELFLLVPTRVKPPFIYTIYLKRWTIQCSLINGRAGRLENLSPPSARRPGPHGRPSIATLGVSADLGFLHCPAVAAAAPDIRVGSIHTSSHVIQYADPN